MPRRRDGDYASMQVRGPELGSWEIAYQHLPADRYPKAAALSGLFPRLDDLANFTLMVDLLIEAIAARARIASADDHPAASRPRRTRP